MPKILVVDDDVDFQKIMRRMLEGEGYDYDVDVAEDGDRALEQMREGEPPVMVLLDVMMATTLEGVDVARQIPRSVALPLGRTTSWHANLSFA